MHKSTCSLHLCGQAQEHSHGSTLNSNSHEAPQIPAALSENANLPTLPMI